jgi:hypothetical protein
MEARRRNIHLLAYNTRFLILPWVTVPHLASHILGRMARLVPGDWERLYAHPVYLLETFIDPERFRGTCYRAANWVLLGRTTGRGKNDLTHKANRSIKEVLALPLHRRFRELLREARCNAAGGCDGGRVGRQRGKCRSPIRDNEDSRPRR